MPDAPSHFPSNPEEGYIDGSIFLIVAHNPVDVHSITFGDIDGDELEASFDIRLLFEFEGSGIRNRDAHITTKLRID